MRRHFRFFVFLVLNILFSTYASGFVNLTPWPKQITENPGQFVLPPRFTIGGNNLPDSVTTEIQCFINDFNKVATNCTAIIGDENNCTVKIRILPKPSASPREKEGYTLSIHSAGIEIESTSATGVYYAFVTIKKLLPACIGMGVKDTNVTEYALPCLKIHDQPTFAYRGFMLDCARHFFDVTEIKRMLDIMAVYKLNRFHWHLTDDQGWRAEIKRYPKLTTIGATAANCWLTDLHEGPYWTNKTYGPYYYTQEQMREVVAYAKARHIEIVPEIEFPGHAVAALAAYPEFSCQPKHPEAVWTKGGISPNVLNVGNPDAIVFVKNILTEIMDIFPYELIHIGGDECPIDAWKKNPQCQSLYDNLHLSHYRALQSHFNTLIADFVGKRGRRIATWNESIDCEGADTERMVNTNATIWCWTNAYANAERAAKMGLDAMLTPWTRGYINRAQSKDDIEATLPGDGSDNVKNVYEINPFAKNVPEELRPHYIGIQGTFWTEHIGTNDMMEYMALPRLLCIAETAWTPCENKDFNAFQKRLAADTLLFNYGKYHYAKHCIPGYQEQEINTPSTKTTIKEATILATCAKTYTKTPAIDRYSEKSIDALKHLLKKADNFPNLDEKRQKALEDKVLKKTMEARKSKGTLQIGKHYRFRCSIEGYGNAVICDNGSSEFIQADAKPTDKTDIWIVTQSHTDANGNQHVLLRNAATGRFIGNNATQHGRAMWPIVPNDKGTDVVISFNPKHGDHTLSVNGKNLIPLSDKASELPNTLSSGNCTYEVKKFVQAVRLQGAAWHIEEIIHQK